MDKPCTTEKPDLLRLFLTHVLQLRTSIAYQNTVSVHVTSYGDNAPNPVGRVCSALVILGIWASSRRFLHGRRFSRHALRPQLNAIEALRPGWVSDDQTERQRWRVG